MTLTPEQKPQLNERLAKAGLYTGRGPTASWISGSPDKPLRQKPNSHLLCRPRNLRWSKRWPTPGWTTFSSTTSRLPATDGYPLAATLFLPRGAKRHAVLINSATAVPRKIYRGFAGYLAQRGCAVLTYDYRGIGDSRQQALTGYNQPKSLVGFKASMSDWAALDVTAAVQLDARALQRRCPSPMSAIPSAARRSACCRTIPRFRARCSIAAQAGYWKLMTSPERYRVYAMLNFVGMPLTRALGYAPGWSRPRRGPAEGRVSAMGRLGDEPALSVRRSQARRRWRIFANYKGAMRALCMSDDPWATRPAVELLCSGIHLDQARDHHGHARRRRREQDRPFRILPPRASRHAVAGCGGMDRGGGIGSSLASDRL